MCLKQSINLKSVRNARELGGFRSSDGRTVKSGVLLRTAKLDGISSKDSKNIVSAIAYLKNTYGSVLGYIRDGLHITQDEINTLKEKYLSRNA